MSDNEFRRRPPADDEGDGGDGGGDDRGGRRPRMGRGRHVQYCPDGKCFDYKNFDMLRRYIGETGKIKPRRQTGNCARCQRELAREIKRARHLALLPFVVVTD
ncbi:MAG: 30S ribosomal protein S18 [Anaerolineae bacterium]|nr:30S ribosomal protein S18 [Anaerolineae bacterium]